MKIYITGYGLISAIGIGEEETLASLRASRSGITVGKKDETRAFKVGEVALSNDELKDRFHLATE